MKNQDKSDIAFASFCSKRESLYVPVSIFLSSKSTYISRSCFSSGFKGSIYKSTRLWEVCVEPKTLTWMKCLANILDSNGSLVYLEVESTRSFFLSTSPEFTFNATWWLISLFSFLFFSIFVFFFFLSASGPLRCLYPVPSLYRLVSASGTILEST